MSRSASPSRAAPWAGAFFFLAAVLVAGPGLAAPATADVLEVRSTGKVRTTRLGEFTEAYAAAVVAPDGSRRALPDFVVGGSGGGAGGRRRPPPGYASPRCST